MEFVCEILLHVKRFKTKWEALRKINYYIILNLLATLLSGVCVSSARL